MAQRHLLAKAAGLASAGLLAAAAAASGETLTFTLPADPVAQPFQRWTVPAGVCGATFDLFGAEGSTGAHGGAEVTTTLPVVPGTPYDIYVGGEGFLGKAGFNGGGAASGGGVGGGGATDVRNGPGFADRVLVAGGGGGNGSAGTGSIKGLGGSGGLLGQDGTKATSVDDYRGAGGGGGTATSGGTAGAAGPNADSYAGSPGTLGLGGRGGVGDATETGGPGGGGGGGFYGGGGGGAGASGAAGGGGGGGSSLTAGGTVSMFPHAGNGKAIIAYTPSSCGPGSGGPGSGGPGSGPGSAGDKTNPALDALSFSSTTFRAARSGPSIARAQVGTDVSFSLSEASSVKFTVQRRTKGRRVHGKCRTSTPANRQGKACTLWKAVRGSFSVAGTGGTNNFKFRGRIARKTLSPGSYRLSGQATDPAKNTSLPTNQGFRIVR